MLTKDIIEIARDFIAENPLGVVGTVDAAGKPWGAAVYLGCDDRFNLYFSTKSETRKHQNLSKNPHISVVFTAEEPKITIQALGKADPVEHHDEARAAADALQHAKGKKVDWVPPLEMLEAGSYQLYKITVEYARLSGFDNQPDIIEYTPAG